MVKNKAPFDSTDVLFQEIDDELKQEKMMNFWKKYGLYAMLVVVVALTLAVSYESIIAWKNKKAQTWSEAYAYAFNLQVQGDFDKSIAVFEDIADKNNGIFKDLARIQIANAYLEQDNISEGVKALQDFVNDDDADQSLRDAARVKLASYLLESAPTDQINALVEPLLIEKGPWFNIAKELKAMLAIRENDFQSAKQLYLEILNNPDNLQEGMKTRAQDMIAVLNEQTAQ